MKKTTFILLLILALFSCKKKTYITIQAENYISGEGSDYAGATYSVVESYTPFLEVKSKQVATGTLDENGHAAFEIRANVNRKYKISLTQPDNVCYTAFRNYQSLDEGGDNVFNFKYGTCGYARIPLDNINCIDETDNLHYTFYSALDPDIYIFRPYIGGSADDYHWNNEVSFAGGCVSRAGRNDPVPFGPYTLDWRVTRGTDTTYGTDTFYVNENDTTVYLLEY